MQREPVKVYLGLGSNLGECQDNLHRALDLLSERLRKGKVSSVYDTEPLGDVNQPRFLNQVCEVYTMLAPMDLLSLAKGIELKVGRVPSKTNAPRTIDIDILFYGDQVVDTPDLIIPHPRLTERAFVLVPLAEIAPELVHPIKRKTVKQLLASVGGVQGVRKWDSNKGH